MVDKCGLAARAWKLELTDTSTKVDMATIHTIVGECPNTNFGTSFSPIDRNKGHHDSGLTNHTNIVVHGDNNIAHNTNPDKLVSDNPYLCGHPGAVTPPKGGCNWDFETTIAAAYPGDVNNALKQFRYVSLPDPVDPCSTTTDCTTTSGTVCGTAWKKGVDLNEQMKIGQCGYLRGYWSANQICGVTDGQFPGNSFVDCTGGNLKLYKCNDNIASCYNQAAATTSCCGCVDWKQDKDINVAGGLDSKGQPFTELCYAKNPTWTSNILPSLTWLKTACPSAYTYPFDDMSSTFACSSDPTFATENTVSYLVIFCPDNGAFSANNPSKVSGNRVVRFHNNCEDAIWAAIAGGAGKNIDSSLSAPKSTCVTDSDCYSGTKCITRGSAKDCFFANPEPQGGKYKLQKGEEIDFHIPILDNQNDVIWSGIMTARKGCGDTPGTKICDIADCRGATATSDFKCNEAIGFSQPATQFEITMQKKHLDYYDVEVINGHSVAIEVQPTV